jgi:hypothetical protein
MRGKGRARLTARGERWRERGRAREVGHVGRVGEVRRAGGRESWADSAQPRGEKFPFFLFLFP